MAQNRYYSSTTKRTRTTVDPGSSGATLTVTDTSSFAGLDSTFPYTLLVNWGLDDQEIVTCTARPSGTTFTVTRGQDGTTGQAHPIGATVDHGVSARDFNDAGAHVGASSAVHGLAGAVVGTTDTQTLSNKTVLQGVATKTANYTATATDNILLVSAASGSVTITLPTAVGATGQTYTIKRTDTTYTNTLTVATTSSQTIDGATTYGLLWVQYAYVQVVSDGSNWQIIDGSTLAEPWQTTAFSSGQWANRGAGFPNLQFRRLMSPSNCVQLVGDIKFTSNGTTGLTNGATIMTVPSAYRPTNEQKVYAVPGGGGSITSANDALTVTCDSTGAVKIFKYTSVTTNGTVAIIELDGIFSLDA